MPITQASHANGMFRYITNKVDKASAALLPSFLPFVLRDEGEEDLG